MNRTGARSAPTWRIVNTAGGFFLIIGFLLFTEHRAHVIGVLPWLILLACPLLHLFMSGGHGSHGHSWLQPERPISNPYLLET